MAYYHNRFHVPRDINPESPRPAHLKSEYRTPGSIREFYKPAFDISHVEIIHEKRAELPPRRPSPDYKPAPLRWIFLAITGIALLALVGTVVAACLILPPETDRSNVPGEDATSVTSTASRNSPALSARAYETNLAPRQFGIAVPTATVTAAPGGAPSPIFVEVTKAPITTAQSQNGWNPWKDFSEQVDASVRPVDDDGGFGIGIPSIGLPGDDEGGDGDWEPPEFEELPDDDDVWIPSIGFPGDKEKDDDPAVTVATRPPKITTPAAPLSKSKYTSFYDGFWEDENGKLYLTPGGPEVSFDMGGRITTGTLSGKAWSMTIRQPHTTMTTYTLPDNGPLTPTVVVHSSENFATLGVWTVDQWDDDVPWTLTRAPATAQAGSDDSINIGAIPGFKKTTAVITASSTKGIDQPTHQTLTVIIPQEAATVKLESTIVTLTDSAGTPTATVMSISAAGMNSYVRASVLTMTNAAGAPMSTMTVLLSDSSPAYVRPVVLTLTDSAGVPTATVTRTPPPLSTPTVLTLTGSDGVPTATITTTILAAPRTITLTNTLGLPTATIIEYPSAPTDISTRNKITKVYSVSKSAYFIGFFLPPILSGFITIPIRMIDLSAKQLQPWHELTRVNGAPASASLALRTGGIYGFISSFQALAGGQVLVFLTTLLTLCSVALVPLSSEAVALKLHGSCTQTDFRGCAMTLGVFLGPARATIALLVAMVVLILCILVALRRWRSGVASNPWTIAGISSLGMNRDVRALFAGLPRGIRGRVGHKRLERALEGRMFKLGYYIDGQGTPEYGIVVHRRQNSRDEKPRLGTKLSLYMKMSRDEGRGPDREENEKEYHLPFLMLSYTWRIVFLVFLSGLLALIAVYNKTRGDTSFDRFMASQGFGVQALFTLIGIGITFYWSSFFTSLALLSPYHVLSQAPQPAERSLLLSPPLHALTGIWSSIRRGHPFLVIVAITSIISEFLPILLNNVPFQLTQTYNTHKVCTWLSVAVLCVMWLVVFGSFFVSWPHMPIDPSTIGGAMYYVCDSQMLTTFEGLSVLPKEERDRRVCEMGAKFRFGVMIGASGARRVGVDRVHGSRYAV
ncbi:hypothetical protein OQA88_2885 [Cercophora sp. LCS_1]